MKLTNSLLGLFSCLAFASQAQKAPGVDSTGLPGDNFSLKGALAMFQKSSSPEEFEKLLNSRENDVNNLDLNEDGDIDYIRVIDNSEKDAHAFVIQALISEKESQDIAVIGIEKTGDTSAVLQIVGDEDIYGEELIMEPDGGGDDGEAFYGDLDGRIAHGPNGSYAEAAPRLVVNVWFWPSVRFIYGPAYRPWVSPWRWRHYPAWWTPWRPFAWRVWHPRLVVHHRPFVTVRTHRVVRAHAVYRPVRVSSVTVRTRHATTVNNYRVTRSKTTVTGPRGHKATRTTTTVRGAGGKVKARKTTVRRR